MHSFNKLVVVISGLLLSGCSTQKTYTGGTNVSSKPYYCRGEWYYPQNYYEYDKIGIASWYGKEFEGRRKASGLVFDPNDFTAAHRTLPIPTVIKVTNLRNGRAIVVVVDDRGPYTYAGRILDLSYGAAKALDLHRYTPSKVRIQSLPEDSLRLSNYIRNHCIKRRDPYGRSWTEIYYQEIRKTKMPNRKATARNLKQKIDTVCKQCRKAIVYS